MQYKDETRSIDSLFNDIIAERVQLKHKLQRKEGQWSNKRKYDLIDSLFRNYIIDPTCAISERIDLGNGRKRDVFFVIDGVQRLSTVREYMSDKFKVPNKYNSMASDTGEIEVNGEVFDIRGKFFSQLDDDIKWIFKNRQLQMYVLTEYTEREVRVMFDRKNAGVPLKPAQKAVVFLSDELRECLDSLALHPFWRKCAIGNNDYKNDSIRNIVLESMWTLCMDECPITDFNASDNGGLYKVFAAWLMENNAFEGISEELTEVINKLDELIKEKQSNLKKATIAPVVYGMHLCLVQGKPLDRFINQISILFDNYDSEDFEWYRNGIKDAANSKAKIMWRLGIFEDFVNAIEIKSLRDIMEERRRETERLDDLNTGVDMSVVDRSLESEEDRITREKAVMKSAEEIAIEDGTFDWSEVDREAWEKANKGK